jgi:hypothetical protein
MDIDALVSSANQINESIEHITFKRGLHKL